MGQGVANDREAGAWPLVARLVAADGSGEHRWACHLATSGATQRDLADAVHALCMLHGHHPGLADEARTRGAQPTADAWLRLVASHFAGERALLAQLVAAAGPLPSTPGHAVSEGTIVGQAHALAMLARSDRSGCATGAVAALALDWSTIRQVLARAGEAFGTPITPIGVAASDLAASVDGFDAPAQVERAIGFGAQQLLAQHRGLWDLLEARAEARG